jgi:hypothetical protein
VAFAACGAQDAADGGVPGLQLVDEVIADSVGSVSDLACRPIDAVVGVPCPTDLCGDAGACMGCGSFVTCPNPALQDMLCFGLLSDGPEDCPLGQACCSFEGASCHTSCALLGFAQLCHSDCDCPIAQPHCRHGVPGFSVCAQ